MKTIIVNIIVPDEIKYIAIQPWGEVMGYINRPVIANPYTVGEEYWDIQDGEVSITKMGDETNWRESLKEINTETNIAS
jgi:hypothetical protein